MTALILTHHVSGSKQRGTTPGRPDDLISVPGSASRGKMLHQVHLLLREDGHAPRDRLRPADLLPSSEVKPELEEQQEHPGR